jgi:ATP-dependent Clp endopeptidase proteolytic subunit ClpP
VTPQRTRARSSAITMMPIGVPKVPYRSPGAYQADWVDLYNRLYRERIVFLGQQISDDIANQIIGVMLYLDSEDNNKPMYMYINSPGGSVTAGFAMFDTMRYVKADVSTINVGLAASMGSLLLAGGSKGKRLALPHSRVMIHQPSMGGIRGQASDIKVEAEMILGIRERVINYYAQLSGQSREKVALDLDRDNFLSAQEAMAYGLVDRIVE